MSSYKSGKIVFHTSAIIVTALVFIFIILPVIVAVVLVSAYFINTDIVNKGMAARLNVDNYEQLVLESDTVTVVYNGREFVNPNNGFREYYSESHKTPVESNDESSPLFDSSTDTFFVCVSDGDYTCKAVYEKDVQSFVLYCIADKYSVVRAKDYNQSTFLLTNSKAFPYDSKTHFEKILSYIIA